MLGLFVCNRCNCLDSVELAEPDEDWLCTTCQGKPWHELFEKRPYDPEEHFVVNRETGLGLG